MALTSKVLLITPPFTQLNTPYPATAYLKGFLTEQNITANQADLGIDVILKIFSNEGLLQLFNYVTEHNIELSENSKRIYYLKDEYIKTINPVIEFLQNSNNTLSHNICKGNYLPQASRFNNIDDLDWAFGTMGNRDKARHLATLYLEDICDFIVENIDPHFGFSRYAERLGRSANSFDELYTLLSTKPTYVDNILFVELSKKIEIYNPTVVAITIPFPGNLYSALRIGQWLKNNYPTISICVGGGFPNTELRSLKEPRIFEFIDYITLDDGEAPITNLIEFIEGKRKKEDLKRTFLLENGEVIYLNKSETSDFSHSQIGTPNYTDLPLNKYLSVIEVANPMHSLWSDGRWNKLTMAHGCYWAKCAFCDVTLDYIKRYDKCSASVIVDRMEALIKETGESGFHFVDEAAPPVIMREVALEILRRRLSVTWWTNIRFEKSFTDDLCQLLAMSGCIAVSGGLEVASDRILQQINKGVTIEQVANCTKSLTEAGIMVHAYLMYGFPTQSAQETIDSLEVVRQLFMHGLINSGFWHQFAMTAHSPVGLNAEKFGVSIPNKTIGKFANNDIIHLDTIGCNHEMFGEGLKKAIFNYMHGICFEFRIQDWFDFSVPRTTIPPKYIERLLTNNNCTEIKKSSKIIWISPLPEISFYSKNKKGKKTEMAKMVLQTKKETIELNIKQELSVWINSILTEISIDKNTLKTIDWLEQEFTSSNLGDFDIFMNSYTLTTLKNSGLLIL